MVYSKIYQQKYAYKLEIDITETKCPVCHRFHLRMSESGVITCRCGYVLDNSHDYVAGIHINKPPRFKINKITKNNEEEDKENE